MGRDVTTIECPRNLQEQLKGLKLFPNESYASVISRLLAPNKEMPVILKGHQIRIGIRKKEEVIK